MKLIMMETLFKKLKYDLRGLYEVQTNDKGVELIGNAIATTRELISTMEAYISEIEMDNERLSMMIENNDGLKREHSLMKQALETTVKIDELGEEVKKRIIEGNN